MTRGNRQWRVRTVLGILVLGSATMTGCAESDADAATTAHETTSDAVGSDTVEGPMPDDAESAVSMYLNFVSIEVDDDTMRMLEDESCIIHTIARVDRSRDRTESGLPTAIYANFDNTYIEFKADDRDGRPGESSVVFSVDRALEYGMVNWSLQGVVPGRPISDLRTMAGGERPIKWYYQLKLASDAEREAEKSAFDAYLMQYHVEAFMALHIPPRDDRRLTRFAYLNAGVEDIGSWGAVDIVGAIVSTTEPEAKRLDRLMYAGRYRESSRDGGTRYDGPGFRLDVLHDVRETGPRVAHLVLRMRTPPTTNEVHEIGNSSLRIGTDGVAVWSFNGS